MVKPIVSRPEILALAVALMAAVMGCYSTVSHGDSASALVVPATKTAAHVPHKSEPVWRINVNVAGPATGFRTAVGWNAGGAGNGFGVWPPQIFRPLKELGISAIRTHDIPEMDWPQLFPNWNANPNLPGSYNFQNSDRILKAMVRQGFTPFLRLGISWSNPAGRRYGDIATNPPNPKKWAIIAEHIVAHDVSGWDHGHHFPIKYVEIWNEPTSNPHGRFWSGTPRQFYVLCADALGAINKAFPKLQVGACGACYPNRPAFTIDLLNYLAAHHVPLDFFSWHVYEGNPVYIGKKGDGVSMFLRFARLAKRNLQKSGYPHAQSICSEWNAACPTGPATSTEILDTLMVAEDEGMAGTYLYPLVQLPPWISPDHVHTWTKSKRAYAFRVFWLFRKITPLRIIGTRGSVFPHAMVMAARSRHGDVVQVLLSDQQLHHQVEINVQGLQAGRAHVEWMPLDARHSLQPVDGGTIRIPSDGKLRLIRRWKAPEVMLVRLRMGR